MGFGEFIKKHWVLFCLLLLLPFALAVVFNQIGGITKQTWLSFWGAVLTYLGTIALSAVALFQTQKANELSEKVYFLSEREYAASFALEDIQQIEPVGCDNHEFKKQGTVHIPFCYVDSTPDKCQGYIFTLKNVGTTPVVKVSIKTTYPIGRNRQEETLVREKDVVIAPNSSAKILLCNYPEFLPKFSDKTFVLTCTNIYGRKMVQEIELSSDSVESPRFSIKIQKVDSLQ